MTDDVAQENGLQTGYTLTMQDNILPMNQFIRDYVRIFEIAGHCASCESYGRRWNCPPFKFASMEFWQRYKRIQLVAYILIPDQNTDASTLLYAVEREKSRLLSALLKQENSLSGSSALSADQCTLCGEDCARINEKPCRHQDKMRYSMKSLGADVERIAEQCFKMPMQRIEKGTVPDYMILIGALLLR